MRRRRAKKASPPFECSDFHLSFFYIVRRPDGIRTENNAGERSAALTGHCPSSLEVSSRGAKKLLSRTGRGGGEIKIPHVSLLPAEFAFFMCRSPVRPGIVTRPTTNFKHETAAHPYVVSSFYFTSLGRPG